MKRSKLVWTALVVAVVAALLTLAATQTTAGAAGPEIVPNGSFETADGALPASWRNDYWGQLTASFTYPTTGAHSGTRSSRIDVTSYTDGGAKWSFTPQTVTPNTVYTYSSWYRSNSPSEILVVYTTTGGSVAYQWLANVPAAANWTQFATTFTSPAGVATMTVFQTISSVGFVQTDDFSITGPDVVVPPSATVTAPTAGATITGATTLTATTTGAIAGVTFLVDGVAVGTEDTTAPYSVIWNSTAATNGGHSITAQARPATGANVTSAPVAVTVNNTAAPTVTVTAPTAGSTISGTTNLTATATGSVAGVTFLVDGVAVGAEDTTAPYSLSWNSTTVTNATHSVTAQLRPTAGATVTSSPVSFVVNNVAPTVTVTMTAPAANATITGTTTLTATTTGPVAGVTFLIDGVAVGTEDTTAPYSLSWNSTTVINGSHTVSARARPNTTGTPVTSATRTINVNNVLAPTITLTAPAAGAAVTGSVPLSATVSGLTTGGVTFLVDGVAVGTDTTSPYSINWSSATVANGSHAVAARVNRRLGGTITSNPRTITVNNFVVPTVSVSAPVAGATVSGTTTVTANATGSVAGVTFRVDGVALGAEDTTAPYSASWNTTTATNGARAITAVARPTTGANVTSAVVNVTVNNVIATTVTVTAPAPGATVTGAVDLTAATTGSVAGVTFLVDGVAVGAEDTAAPYTAPWDSATITNGSHAVTAQARPTVGATVTSTPITVTVSNIAVTITAPTAGATVTGPTNLTATTNSPVAGVTFLLDNTPVGVEDTTAPYAVSWDSVVVPNGSHTLIAQARLATGANVTSLPVVFTVSNVVSPPGGGGIVPNPSLETAATGNPNMAANWRADKWGANTTTFSYPTGGAHGGTKSSRIDVTSFTDGGAKWSFDPVLVTPNTAYDYSSWYKSNQPSEVLVVYETTTGTIAYQWLNNVAAAANWTQYRTQLTTPANARTMTVFQSITAVGWLQTDDFTIAPATTTVGFNRPLISLTFDDGVEAHATLAFPKLQQTGMRGTFYLVSSYTDDAGPPVQLTTAQIRAINAAGNEIGSHTVDHADLVTVSSAQQTAQLVNSKAALEALIGEPVTELASPYGSYNTAVLDKIKATYQSHRTVINGFNTKTSTDMYQLRQQLILNTTTLADVQSWIDAARAQNSWLILTFHDIYNNPETYDITPANLNAFLDAVDNSGITVLPVGEARAEVAPQLG